MKVVIQRSKNASVSVDNKVINQIDHGFVILVGFTQEDNSLDIDYIVKKITNLTKNGRKQHNQYNNNDTTKKRNARKDINSISPISRYG